MWRGAPERYMYARISGAKAFDSISNLAYGAFQQVERMDLVARSYLLRGGISVVAFLLLLFAGADIATALFSQLLVERIGV